MPSAAPPPGVMQKKKAGGKKAGGKKAGGKKAGGKKKKAGGKKKKKQAAPVEEVVEVTEVAEEEEFMGLGDFPVSTWLTLAALAAACIWMLAQARK